MICPTWYLWPEPYSCTRTTLPVGRAEPMEPEKTAWMRYGKTLVTSRPVTITNPNVRTITQLSSLFIFPSLMGEGPGGIHRQAPNYAGRDLVQLVGGGADSCSPINCHGKPLLAPSLE